ncbi:MAG: phosphoribosylglycinamide formyltransferase, partial [Spirochaetes bacterium]|nr:phosphoribosylglycinamide formyltransferase [Spirochaetota bacterium]
MSKKKIAVFISGRGSNFKAILNEINKGTINGSIELVISDNPDAKGLLYARDNDIECAVFKKSKDCSRSDYFDKIISTLRARDIDLILLAGFMKVLSGNIVRAYRNRVLNIHPALLPSFPGEQAQKQALEYGVKFSGCTVHIVDEGVDTGPIVLQEAVPVLDDDTEEVLSDRILEKEHIIYSRAVKL